MQSGIMASGTEVSKVCLVQLLLAVGFRMVEACESKYFVIGDG